MNKKTIARRILTLLLVGGLVANLSSCKLKDDEPASTSAKNKSKKQEVKLSDSHSNGEKEKSDEEIKKEELLEIPAYAEKFITKIDEERIYGVIKELASEKYNGRLTGTKGNELATEYIRDKFKQIGIESFTGAEDYYQSYKQTIPYMRRVPKVNVVDDEGNVINELIFREEFISMVSEIYDEEGKITGELINIKTEKDYEENKDFLEGKVALINRELLWQQDISEYIRNQSKVAGVIIDTTQANRAVQVFKKPVYYSKKSQDNRNDEQPLFAYVNKNGVDKLKVCFEEGYKVEIDLDYYIEEKEISNVLGMIKGDSNSEELLVISGHFDHLGSNYDGTYNPGASDNASGIACMLEIARIIKESEMKPKQTIVFAAFNGEENGLYGSKYFAEEAGIDMEKVTMINIDMVANNNDGELNIAAVKWTKLIADSEDIGRAMGIECNMILGSRSSDHLYVEENGGEAITIVEIEFDDYHTPKDNIDIIDKTELREVVELAFRIIEAKFPMK